MCDFVPCVERAHPILILSVMIELFFEQTVVK